MESRRVVVSLSTALVLMTGLAFYFWHQNDKDLNQTKIETQTEAQQLVSRISQFLILPADEEPTIATVSNLEVLKDQPFFAKAKIGDKVLIYAKARKAILYDSIADKIVEIAPINLGNKGGL